MPFPFNWSASHASKIFFTLVFFLMEMDNHHGFGIEIENYNINWKVNKLWNLSMGGQLVVFIKYFKNLQKKLKKSLIKLKIKLNENIKNWKYFFKKWKYFLKKHFFKFFLKNSNVNIKKLTKLFKNKF